jgi:subtilisin family serine protease
VPRPVPRPANRARVTIPPAGETRYVPDEVMVRVRAGTSAAALARLAAAQRLTVVQSQRFALLGATVARLRITDGRPVSTVIRALASDGRLAAIQPNYRYALQEDAPARPAARAPQYAPALIHLDAAHKRATGAHVLVAVIDSGIDGRHPELAGTVAGRFNALTSAFATHAHGTAVAGIIAAHATLDGAAPDARLLAARAFSADEGSTMAVMRALDWAAGKGARVVNMSFAGPHDPMLGRMIAAAIGKGMVIVAAAGNAGPSSPPAFPGAEPGVIAVTAVDDKDGLFAEANRGRYVGVAAPGVDILVAAPGDAYGLASGTSMAAAFVSGVAALLLERRPRLEPADVARILAAGAADLGAKGRDPQFGAGLIDADRSLDDAIAGAASPTVKVSTRQTVH